MIVEDNALLREGVVALLRERDIDVVAQAEDGPGLLRVIAGHKPDLAIVDVRLAPSFTDEGLRSAIEAYRARRGLPQKTRMNLAALTFARAAGVEPQLENWPHLRRALLDLRATMFSSVKATRRRAA